MDARQEIGLGSAASSVTQSYQSGGAVKADDPVQVSFSFVQANATAQNNNQTADSGSDGQQRPASQPVNPRTVLDPEMFVNVAQYSYGNGAVEFQVPSKSQIEAYRRGMDQGGQQQQQTEEQAVRTQQVRETSDGDGSDGVERQAAGTVAASAVAGTPEATGTRQTQQTGSAATTDEKTASPEQRAQQRQTVALEA